MTEREIILGCQKGDKSCERALVKRYSGRMFAVSFRYAKNRQDAQDILQDAFIKIFKNIVKFKIGPGAFEGWLRRIVVNTALRKYDRSSVRNEMIGLDYSHEKMIEPAAYSNLNEEVLLNLISKLPLGYKQVFNLNVIEGYSHKEIAEMLEIGESSSRSQLTRAKKMLQQQILEIQKIKLHADE